MPIFFLFCKSKNLLLGVSALARMQKKKKKKKKNRKVTFLEILLKYYFRERKTVNCRYREVEIHFKLNISQNKISVFSCLRYPELVQKKKKGNAGYSSI